MNKMLRSYLIVFAVLAIVRNADAQGGPSPVQVAIAEQKTIQAGKSFVGTVRPTQHAILGSAVNGRVIEFNFEEGDRIENGGAVAQLLTKTISLQLEAAQGELAARQAELDELVNGTRPEEIEQMEARMLAAEARMRYLNLRRDRSVELYEKNKVTSAEVRDEAVSAADAAKHAYLEAKAAHALSVAGPRTEQIAQVEARVAMQKAIVQELEDRINKYTIRARFTGYLVKKSTEVGAWANSGGPIAEIVHLDSVDVVANVPEHDIPYVEIGRNVTVEIFAIPSKLFQGKVLSITPQADLRARTFPVKIRVTNEMKNGQPLLKSGMMGRVMLQTGEKKVATLVPKDAIVLGGRSPMVYVVSKGENGQIVNPVPVTLGVAEGAKIEVEGPIPPGTQVVTHGNERLRPGQSISILQVAKTTE